MMDLFHDIFSLPTKENIICKEHGMNHHVKIFGFSDELNGNYCKSCIIERLVLGLEKHDILEN